MEMLVGMEDKQVGTARSRAGSCVEFYTVKVSFLCSRACDKVRSVYARLHNDILCGKSGNIKEFH